MESPRPTCLYQGNMDRKRWARLHWWAGIQPLSSEVWAAQQTLKSKTSWGDARDLSQGRNSIQQCEWEPIFRVKTEFNENSCCFSYTWSFRQSQGEILTPFYRWKNWDSGQEDQLNHQVTQTVMDLSSGSLAPEGYALIIRKSLEDF
jgi:hypothetical protein